MTNRTETAIGVGSALLENVGAFAAGVVERLRESIPSYSAVPPEEHLELVRTQISDILTGLLAGRGPGPRDLVAARELGWRRAAQGVPLPAVIEAYHSCYREIWQALVAEAADDGDRVRELVGSVAVLWSWTHQLSASVASGHAEALQTRFAEKAELRRRFFRALGDGRAGDPQTAELATELDLDPDGEFQALCVGEAPERTPDELQQALDWRPGAAVCGSHGRVVVVLVQGMALDAVVEHLGAEDGTGGVGVGIARRGLGGAVATIADAELALRLAERRAAVVRFAESWPECLAFEHREALREPLAPGLTAAAEHPHLAATVQAFADCGFRVTDCARRMHLHPNSAKYRLDRWRELTGWDVQTFDGLMRSLASIAIVRTTTIA